MPNGFDVAVMHWVNGFVGRVPAFDALCSYVAMKHLFKGAVLLAALWAVWLTGTRRAKEIAASSAVAALLAVALARAVANLAPYRARPIHDASLHLRLARGLDPQTLNTWSSFPSDHAAFFMAIAVGVFLAHRRIGALALAWGALVICAVRIYLGIHYPTDILAGAAIGGALAWLLSRPAVSSRLAAPVLRLEAAAPLAFCALAFIASFEAAELFDGLRGLSSALH